MDNPVSSCGCQTSCDQNNASSSRRSFVKGTVLTPVGDVPQISTRLDALDRLGAIKVRLGIRRDRYRIDPGLYAVGTPNDRSDVLVTANYKLTFDSLRKNLSGLNVWLLVLDTNGINVWCAAGKGTFGTSELIKRIRLTSLEAIVKHRRIILPQLGAVGIAAHLVKNTAGFTVLYGPVRASDIPEFMHASYKATEEMRLVRFGLYDRAKLIPNDFFSGMRYLLAAMVFFAILAGVTGDGFSLRHALERSGATIRNVGLGYFSGIVLTPLFLPFIPVRAFALKGALMGLLLSALLYLTLLLGNSAVETIAWILLLTGLSSFLAVNFTGSSTYTSLSGVKKEVRVAVPLQISSVALAAILLALDNTNII